MTDAEPQVVFTVRCVGDDGFDVMHIFSTAGKALAFAESDYRPHVISDYVIDHPERMEQVTQ